MSTSKVAVRGAVRDRNRQAPCPDRQRNPDGARRSPLRRLAPGLHPYNQDSQGYWRRHTDRLSVPDRKGLYTRLPCLVAAVCFFSSLNSEPMASLKDKSQRGPWFVKIGGEMLPCVWLRWRDGHRVGRVPMVKADHCPSERPLAHRPHACLCRTSEEASQRSEPLRP